MESFMESIGTHITVLRSNICMKQNNKFRHIILVQTFSHVFAGLPLHEIKKFQCITNIFCIKVREVKLQGLADSRDELHNTANYAGYF